MTCDHTHSHNNHELNENNVSLMREMKGKVILLPNESQFPSTNVCINVKNKFIFYVFMKWYENIILLFLSANRKSIINAMKSCVGNGREGKTVCQRHKCFAILTLSDSKNDWSLTLN